MPITTLAVCLPLAAIGTAVLQISISARDTQLPPQMPDIRLQARPSLPQLPVNPLFAGGSPYTLRDAQPYGEPLRRPNKKIERTSFELAA